MIHNSTGRRSSARIGLGWVVLWVAVVASGPHGTGMASTPPDPPFVAVGQGPCVYDNLAAAVMAAQPGQTLLLAAGSWPGSVTIDKDLVLRGSYDAACLEPDAGVTTLRGEGSQVINVIGGRVTLRDLVLSDGEATFGAALRAINGSEVVLDNTDLIANKAFDRGGAAFVDDHAIIILTNDSDITHNQALDRGGGLFISPGGVAILDAGSDLTGNVAVGSAGGGGAWVGGTLIVRGPGSTIRHNLAPNGGGLSVMAQPGLPAHAALVDVLVADNVTTADVSRGGGVFVSSATLLVEHSRVMSNTAALGGGIAVVGTGGVTLTNSLLTHNQAAAPTGGDGLDLAGGSTAVVQQNTFSHNDENGIVVEHPSVHLTMHNNIIWGHSVSSVLAAGGSLEASCNDTEFGALPGLGNIAADPAFVAALDGNYRLRTGSPALDRCDASPTGRDLDGRPRPQGLATDMGAYEGVGCAADVNQDGQIDLRDVQMVAGRFMDLPTYDGTWDYDVVQNGAIDVADIAAVAGLWYGYCY